MTISEVRKLAKYYSSLYRSTGDSIYRESLSYLRGILLKHNLKTNKNEGIK